jgi:hypothetical protein
MSTRSFSEEFAHLPIEGDQNTLLVKIERDARNHAVSEYHFDKKLDVAGGFARFYLSENGTVILCKTLSNPNRESTQTSIDFVNKLHEVHGVIIGQTDEFLEIRSHSVLLFKAVALPDDIFDRSIVTVLADYFGVNLENVQVSYINKLRVPSARSRFSSSTSAPSFLDGILAYDHAGLDDIPDNEEWISEDKESKERETAD